MKFIIFLQILLTQGSQGSPLRFLNSLIGELENGLNWKVIPWLRADEEILRLREMTMLGRVTYVKPNPPLRKGPEDVPCANPIRHATVRGAPAHMKSFVTVLFHVPKLRVGDAVVQIDN